jgi:transposase
MTIAVTRLDLSVSELRRKARRSDDADQARRILAIALVLEGGSREAAGTQRQTLRDWIVRYNAEGLEVFKDRPKPGRTPRLRGDNLKAFDQRVEKGPDIATDKVVRWRCADLKEVAKDQFGVSLSERSIGRVLGKLRFVRLSVRPQRPNVNTAAQEAFKKLCCDGEVSTAASSQRQAP